MVSKFTLYEAIQSPLHECFNYYDNSTAHKFPIKKYGKNRCSIEIPQ